LTSLFHLQNAIQNEIFFAKFFGDSNVSQQSVIFGKARSTISTHGKIPKKAQFVTVLSITDAK
jgi:hypothetical protein